MLTIGVKDFGPIVKGEVQLRPLTIFVGPNNAGKSYLSMLIYAFFTSHFYPGIRSIRNRGSSIRSRIADVESEEGGVGRWAAACRVGAEDGLRDYAVDYLRHGAGHNCKHRLALALSQALGCGEAAPPGQAAIGKSIVRTAVD